MHKLPIQNTFKGVSMNGNDDGCYKAIVALIAIPVVLIVSAVMNGFVLTKLWGWFVVPVFEAPELSLVPAIGLGLVVGYLTYQYTDSDSKESEHSLAVNLITAMLMSVIRPALVLLLGWIIQLFM